ncbi:hypothetical protein F5Y10DRAFT_255225 [Nemania abortiva]|nr:hypothetical protein F5Y10DRAFT_255225 [Nemania abortiva]
MASMISVSTPLPAGVTEKAVVDILHNHDAYIKTTCPQLISQKHVSGAPGLNQPCEYEITDKKSIGKTTFKMTLTNVVQGVDAVIEGRAPTGSMTIRSQWRVRVGKLEEEVEIESNAVTKMLVKGNVEKGHSEYHQYVFPYFIFFFGDGN